MARSLLIVFGLVAVVMAMMPAALAHHPQISGRAYCDSQAGGVVVSGESVSWLRDPNFDGASGNPNIQIRFRINNIGAWTVVAGGAYTAANGYGFTWGPIPWPGGTGDFLVVQAYAAAPFNNGSSQGSHREVLVNYPAYGCQSHIRVDKVTQPATGDNPDFTFDPSWSESNFQLDDNDTPYDSGAARSRVPTASPRSTYPPGGSWSVPPARTARRSSAIELDFGEMVTCTFTDTSQGPDHHRQGHRPAPPSNTSASTPTWVRTSSCTGHRSPRRLRIR